jgi:tetratricopeptide (TPR) repeat protein
MAQGVADDRVQTLLDRLADPDLRNATVVEDEIILLWARSGSASADYLLGRGRDALENGDFDAAYDHLTALVDHAPDFAEGWHARATLFYVTNRFGPSIADLQQALALEPRHFDALMGLGLILEETEQFDTALAAFRAAQAINPHRDDIAASIARIEQILHGQPI